MDTTGGLLALPKNVYLHFSPDVGSPGRQLYLEETDSVVFFYSETITLWNVNV